MPDYQENNDGDSVFVDPETGETYFSRISRPNYTVEAPGSEQEGRESTPNYTVRHPAERQNETPLSILDDLTRVNPNIDPTERRLNAPWFMQSDNPQTDPKSLGEAAEETADTATSAASDAVDPTSRLGQVVWILVIAAGLYLLNPVLGIVENLTVAE